MSNDDTEFSRKKILRQSGVRPTWLSYSPLHNSKCVHESSIERDFFDWVMFEAGLLDIISQPKTYKDINYLPDYYLRYADKEVMVEIKPYSKTQSEKFKAAVKIREAYFKNIGMEYLVFTDKTIRATQQAMNHRIIRPGLNHPKPIAEFAKIKNAIPTCNMSVSKLTQLLLKKKLKACFIRRALAHKIISADLTPRWSEVQIIW